MKNRYEKYLKWLDLNKDSEIDLKDLFIFLLKIIKTFNRDLIINEIIDLISDSLYSESYKNTEINDLEDLDLEILNRTLKEYGNKS